VVSVAEAIHFDARSRLQHRAVEKWVHAQLGTIRHEQRVSEIAQKLFDLTWPLHGLGRRERRLLRLAALVHDVGRAIDDLTHPKQGARMILEADHLPLSRFERRALAYVTRRHRGDVPEPRCDKYLNADDDARTLLIVLALLRAADALDGRSLESPRLVFALLGKQLRITCYLDSECPKAWRAYSRRKKFRLLEAQLDIRIEVRPEHARAIQMVA
jgi:exopolyphosphatase/guanosine-5'-triphosphate,3'-diphosphate pyrophosphatase